MNPNNEPVPATWYRDVRSGRRFCVTNVDNRNDTIAIQHFDGAIEQIQAGEWIELDLELTRAPADWSGPVDRIDTEDLDDGESAAKNPGH
jgi:hypothetical protein